MPFTAVRHGWYLGPLGRLTQVRAVERGYAPVPDLAVVTHKLLSGRVRAESPQFSPRTYSLSWTAMSDAELAWLEQCSLGLVPGPLYWVDPLVRNQLPSHLSVPSNPLEDVSVTVGSLSWSASGSQGFGGIVTSTTGVRKVVTVGVPVVPGFLFTGSAYVTRTGGASTTLAQSYVEWFDAAGALVAPQANGAAPVLAALGVAYRTSVSATPPAGVVTGRLAVSVDGGPVVVDGLQVEFGALSPFIPGPGLAKVAILSYDPDVYMSGITNVAMSMVEVR